MVAELATIAVIILAAGAEQIHWVRCRRIANLAFGPRRRPAHWAFAAPFLRVAASGALCWGLTTLLLLPPKIHRATAVLKESEYRHLLLVLDISPSMRLEDAGPEGKQSRLKRTSELLASFFERVPMDRYKTSVVAVYTSSKPVVVDTTDREVISNILNELPMHHAFKPGATDLFAGLEEASRIARPWNPKSTTLVIVSDGNTVPAVGMPKMPASIAHVLVVGVGDTRAGRFIEGHHSRQDASILRQVAIRLGGVYHNGNEKHLSTQLLKEISASAGISVFERLTIREYALIACGFGAFLLALTQILLHLAGTSWRPGVPVSNGAEGSANDEGFGRRKKRLSPRFARAVQ